MGFANPVGPVSVTASAGVDETSDGNLRLYTRPTRRVLIESAGIYTPGGIEAEAPVIGRGGVYRGGVEPALGTELLPVRGGRVTQFTDALGNITFPHGGPAEPVAVTLTLDGPGTVLDGERMTVTVRAKGPTNVTARIYSPSGALAAGLSVTVHYLALYL